MNNTTGAQTRCGAVRCDAQRCDANRIIVSLSIVQFGESRVPGLGLGDGGGGGGYFGRASDDPRG
jgi:hypothetical protein